MLNFFNIPRISPVDFYWQSDILNTAAYTQVAYKSFNPSQNERGMDNDFFHRNIRSYFDQVKYFQPWQQSDKLVLQWLGVADYTGPTFVNYKIKIIDEFGNTVKQQDVTQGVEVGTGSGVYIREVSMLLYDIPEGKYLVQIHKIGLFADYGYFMISNPIWIKKHWPNTVLIKYKHSENAYEVFWETGIEMWVRVHAGFTELTPGSQFNVYEDDEFDLTLLSGVKYRVWQLSFGVANKLIPISFIDKLEEVTLCDSMYIEHNYFTRAEDSKLEPVPVEKHPLFGANIKLRERTNNANTIVNFYPAIVLGTAPTVEWFSVGHLSQTTPGTSYPIASYFNGAINFVDYLNTANIIGSVDFINTYFAIDNKNQIVLLTNVEAVYLAYSPGLVYSDLLEGHLIIDVETTTTQKNLIIQFVNSIVSTKYRYFYGDGTTDAGTSIGITKTKTYAANGKFRAKLFWNQAEELYLNASHKIIKEIEGKLPLRTLVFDCSDNSLQVINNNIFGIMGSYPSNTNIQLWGNHLSRFAIDKIFKYAFDAIPQFNTPASIDVQVQVPSAIPTIDKETTLLNNKLITAGITILTD